MTNGSVGRAVRQELESCLLAGVDAVPVAAGAQPPGPAGIADPETDASDAPPPAAGSSAPVSVKAAALEALRARHDAECPHCTGAERTHTQTVFGEGNPDARLMFIGEAPGAQEDQTGRPFVGRAGQKLEEMIRAMGLEREDVYIANVLKSRPPNNRTPLRPEIDACSPYLVDQIRIIDPDAIVTLGGPATKLMLGTETGITRLRGQWASFDVDGRAIAVMPTFHPAYLLRNYTRETREQIWSDLKAVVDRLEGA